MNAYLIVSTIVFALSIVILGARMRMSQKKPKANHFISVGFISFAVGGFWPGLTVLAAGALLLYVCGWIGSVIGLRVARWAERPSTKKPTSTRIEPDQPWPR